MANTLKFGNGEWAIKEGSALAYNDENGNFKPLPFDFTRASTATYVAEDGLIKTAAIGEPRIDFLDNSDGSLKLEPQRTNKLTTSSDFSSYSKVGTITTTANYGVSPSGQTDSTRVVFPSSNNAFYKFSLHSGSTETNTIYIKGISGETIKFGKGSTVNSGSIFTLNGEWQRLEFVSTSGNQFSINTYTSVTARDVQIWGAQIEQGSYATSYIPTQGSTVTRVAESCEQTVPSNIFNSVEGVIYTEISSLSNDGTQRRFTFGDANFSNNIRFTYLPTDNVFEVNLYNGSDQGKLSFTLTNATELNKIAYLYSPNDFQLWINGVKVDFVNSGTTFSSGTIVRIAQGDSSAQRKFYGNIKDLKVYNEKLTNAELQALTKI